MTKEVEASRRALLKIGALGAAACMSGALTLRARAQQPQKVKPSDPLPQSLHFVEDASKAPSDLRTDKSQVCDNCQFFQGSDSDQQAPCTIFMGNLVPAKGWCSSWVKKGTGASKG